MTDFSITATDFGLALRGVLDVAAVDAFEHLPAERTPRRALVLDLSELTFIDSAGLNALLALRRRLVSERVQIMLFDVPPNIWAVFTFTGVDRMFMVMR